MSSFFVILNLRNLSYLIAPVLGHGFDSRHHMLWFRACLIDSFSLLGIEKIDALIESKI